MNIKKAINKMEEPSKRIVEILVDFYETMKHLEKDENRKGKQATKIVMTINDIEKLFKVNITNLK